MPNPFFYLSVLLTTKPAKIGGQALIEGVMMRSRGAVAVAVRRLDGSITRKIRSYLSLTKRNRFLAVPMVRGAIILIESLIIGIQELSYSADLAIQDEKQKAGQQANQEKTWKDRATMAFSLILAMILGLGLFMYLPLKLSLVLNREQNPLLYNITAGTIRIVFLVLYIWSISLMKDIRRVFQYHGAEHQCIAALEAGESVTVENATKYSPLHPRCGTSFLFLAAFACILIFALIDGLIIWINGVYLFSNEVNPSAWIRFLVHLPLIPLVSGLSYEMLKWSGEHADRPWIKPLLWPGLGLQRITTSKPDAAQLEVAIFSLQDALKYL